MNAPFPPEQPLRFQPPRGPALTGLVLGEGPLDVVFLPGNGFTVDCYVPALSAIAEAADPAGGVRVHALNPRGHGGGAEPAPFENWDGFLDDLRAYVEQRLQPPVVLAGHSFGAVLSLRLAAEAPALVRGLLLAEPLVRGRREQPWPASAEVAAAERELVERTLARRRAWPSRTEAEADFRGRGGYRYWAEEPLQRFLASGLCDDEAGGVRLGCAPWLEAMIYRTLPGDEMFGWAERARAPAAILGGDASQYVSAEGLAQLADALPVAALYTVRGTHTFPMERPQETGRALAAGLALVLACPPPAEDPPVT